jgi:hypothetical protein
MLRIAVLLLLIANAGYYLWTDGLLRSWGFAPASDAEPQRMEQQIAPDNLRLLPPQRQGGASASAASSAPPALPTPMPPPAAVAEAPACLLAGVFDARQADALRAALGSWPQGSWAMEPAAITGRWMVYMGRFASEDAVAKKRAELRDMKIDVDRPGPALEPGLSLGRFATAEAAERGLDDLARQGVRTARVVQERADANGFTLRLPAVTDALRPRLNALQPALAGKTLRACNGG